jgi:hypothetical protein
MLLILLVCLIVYNSNCRRIGSGDSYPARLLPFEILTKEFYFPAGGSYVLSKGTSGSSPIRVL